MVAMMPPGPSGSASSRKTAGASLPSAAWVSPATRAAIPPGPSDRSSSRAIWSAVGCSLLTRSVRPQSSSSGSSIRRVLTSAWRSSRSRLSIVATLSSSTSSASSRSRHRSALPSTSSSSQPARISSYQPLQRLAASSVAAVTRSRSVSSAGPSQQVTRMASRSSSRNPPSVAPAVNNPGSRSPTSPGIGGDAAQSDGTSVSVVVQHMPCRPGAMLNGGGGGPAAGRTAARQCCQG